MIRVAAQSEIARVQPRALRRLAYRGFIYVLRKHNGRAASAAYTWASTAIVFSTHPSGLNRAQRRQVVGEAKRVDRRRRLDRYALQARRRRRVLAAAKRNVKEARQAEWKGCAVPGLLSRAVTKLRSLL
jgi:hypothetical protein